MKRKIVSIDSEKCDGCGLCVPSCAEGAIKIVDGKAVLAADNLCDGLGACLGECPRDAIRIIEREADEFDAELVDRLQHSAQPNHRNDVPHHGHGGGCPGSRAMTLDRKPESGSKSEAGPSQSRLGQWPVQLTLVPPNAPYFQDADLLITADCVPVAYADYHRDFLAGKAVAMGCPKQPDAGRYVEKLTQILRSSSIKSVTVLVMEVPCCGGLLAAARQAVADSGKALPFRVVTIGITGEIKGDSQETR